MMMVALSGVSATLATGALTTVIALLSLCPLLAAVIVAVPVATAVTTPAELTVATELVDVAQVIVCPASTVPAESRGVAVS